jgi:hypothetical protein
MKAAHSAAFSWLKIFDDFTSFGDGVGFHKFSTDFFGAREVVDIDFEEML